MLTSLFIKKSNNWLGFVIRHNDVSIYIAGDTDVIEEAKQLKVNIMILPVGGTYTMTDKEAAELVKPYRCCVDFVQKYMEVLIEPSWN